MHLHTANLHAGQLACGLVDGQRALDRNAEFALFFAGGNIVVSVGIYVRVDAQGNGRAAAQTLTADTELLELGFTFDIENCHAQF